MLIPIKIKDRNKNKLEKAEFSLLDISPYIKKYIVKISVIEVKFKNPSFSIIKSILYKKLQNKIINIWRIVILSILFFINKNSL